MDEFSLIEKYFKPLTNGRIEAQGLADDVALLSDSQKIITKDILVVGTHFFDGDPLDLVAKKALRANVSDVIAKGMKPTGYLLGCVWKADTKEEDIARFVRGLREDQGEYNIYLLGGDTTRSQVAGSGIVTISITMLGSKTIKSMPITRSGAQEGDRIFVTGTIGNAGLGLLVKQKSDKISTLSKEQRSALVGAYHLPMPPFGFAPVVAQYCSAALDVSDGLIADCGHLADENDLDIHIHLANMPLSIVADDWIRGQASALEALSFLATAGDDFQVLCTVSQRNVKIFQAEAEKRKIDVAEVGVCKQSTDYPKLYIYDETGAIVKLSYDGYNHFKE